MSKKSKKSLHLGQILSEKFLAPLGINQTEFAEHLGWSHAKVNEIIHGKRGITPETALSFSDAFGNTAEYWLNAQLALDLQEARKVHTKKKKIKAKRP